MIKKGISGIILCFFCCVQCFPVFAQEIEQEIVINEDWENSINQNTQESSESSLESTSSPDVEEEEISNEIPDDWPESENPDSWEENLGESWNEDDENPNENLGENSGQNNQEHPEIVFPEIFIDFQNPSYILEKDIQKQEYICDPEREECKVNIKILDENQWEISSDFWCEIIFSNSEEYADCNPTSVVLEESENIINIKIFEENNIDNFIEKEIIILKNNISEENSWDENPENWGESSGEPGNEDEEIIDENESTNSWEDNSQNPDNWTGSIENPDENNEEIPEIIFPEIFIDFQNPSYILEKDIQKQEYSCDPEKQECKVNIKILDETQSEISSDFWCEIIFSNWEEFTDCNPTSIVFTEPENTINIKVFEENNLENIIEKEIIILKNNLTESESPSEWEDDSQNPDNGTGNWENWEDSSWGSWNIDEVDWDEGNEEIPEELEVPEIFFEIQSWAEISGDSLVCDKNNCSLNLNIEKSFQWDFIENNYICEWDFWGWNFSTPETDKKCNPGYVKYNVWEYQLSVKIIDKENPNNFSQKILYVKNSKKSSNKWQSNWWSKGNTNSETENTIVDISENKEIFVQSWLENNRCNEEKCSVNLQYKNASYEECLWDFWEIETRDKYTKTCNPRNIYLPVGWHKITLSVKNNKTNTSHNKILFIHNMYEEKTVEKNYNFEIILQWKKSDFRKKIWDDIICLWVEKCNINLSVKQYKNLEYNWEFPNNFRVDKNNPKSVWFEIWDHNIVLKIYDGQKLLFSKNIWVQVIAPENTQEIMYLAKQVESFEKSQNNYLWFFSELEIQPKNLVNLKDETTNYFTEIINSTQKNFSHKIDSIDYFEIKDKSSRIKLTRNISQQKKALKISGTTFPNSTVYIDDGEKIFTIQSDEIGKYQHKKQSDINSGFFLVDYYVIDEFWNYFQANNYKTVSISDEYIWELTQNIQKKSTKSSQKKKISWTQEDKMKNVDAEKEINYASIWWISTNKMTFWQKILWTWICLIWFLWLFFVGRKYKIM